MHLWVAKYSCIRVCNDWETISRWHTLQLHHDGKALRQQAKVGRGGLGFNQQIHLNPIPRHETPTSLIEFISKASQLKRAKGKMLKEKKENDYNLFSTCQWMHAISNSRCQRNVLFAMNVYAVRRGWYGEEFWPAPAELRLLHPQSLLAAAQEKKNNSNNPWVNWDQL